MRTEEEKMANLKEWISLPKEVRIKAIKRKQEQLRAAEGQQ